jgi:hypothetical protein
MNSTPAAWRRIHTPAAHFAALRKAYLLPEPTGRSQIKRFSTG